jgi:hypothetical protein
VGSAATSNKRRRPPHEDGEGKEEKKAENDDDDDEDDNDNDDDDDGDDDEKEDANDQKMEKNESEKKVPRAAAALRQIPKKRKRRTNNWSSVKSKSKRSKASQSSATTDNRDGSGMNATEQAHDAWRLASDPIWKDSIRIIQPITTQSEFDKRIQDAIAQGNGELRLLLIVSRLIQTETKQVHDLRRACVAAAINKRHPKSRLNQDSESIPRGGINDVTTAAGFAANPSVVYFRLALPNSCISFCSRHIDAFHSPHFTTGVASLVSLLTRIMFEIV